MRVALDKKRFGPWALVTGASSGIGKEFARQIAASGINIVLVARREDLLKEVGVEFSKRYGVKHGVVVLDVSREDIIGQLASATDDLDIGLVVSNAGTGLILLKLFFASNHKSRSIPIAIRHIFLHCLERPELM